MDRRLMARTGINEPLIVKKQLKKSMKKNIIVALAAMCCLSTNAQEKDLPTMGWSSWNTFALNISDSIIMRQADVLAILG